MSDWVTFGIAVSATFALSKAFGATPAKPPKKAGRRSTTHKAATYLPEPRPIQCERTRWPTRVPVDTRRAPEAQNSTIEPPQKRTRRHTGSGPFGANKQIVKAAQRSAFKWSVGPEEYDDSVTGWIEGLSEGDGE